MAAVEPKLFTHEHLRGAAADGNKEAVERFTKLEESGGENDTLSHGDVKKVWSTLQSFHDGEVAAKAKGAEAGSPAKEKSIWPWATAAGLTGAAATALIVWAVMHNHDKKLMAKLAAANSQGN